MVLLTTRDHVLNQTINNISAGACIACVIAYGLTMSEDSFLAALSSLERFGNLIALVEGTVSILVVLLMVRALSAEKRQLIWRAGFWFTAAALVANLLDYWTTIRFSPDLALENNPVWNQSMQTFGLEFALWSGLLAKLGLSLLAGICFTFFASSASLVAPYLVLRTRHDSLPPRAQCRALLTVIAFYFACMNFLCLYVAFANSLVENLPAISVLPPLPAVIVVFIVLITIALKPCTDVFVRSA
jgi:hypothetical protein